MPDVTVILPTKDQRWHFRRALASALAQEGVDLEVIVIDDGSSDFSDDDLTYAAERHVTLIRHERSLGVCEARNAGLAAASSPWVALLDHDDLWAPEKLKLQLTVGECPLADGSLPEWVCCSSVLVDETDRVIGWASAGKVPITVQMLLVDGVVPGGGSGMIARTDALWAIGGFDATMQPDEDWDIWLRLARRGPGPTVDLPLMAYRVWSGSISGQLPDFVSSRNRVADRFAADAARFGVEPDAAAAQAYSAYRFLHAHRFSDAAGCYRALDQLRPGWRAKVLALAAEWQGPWLLWMMQRRARQRVPADVLRAAENWLGAVDALGSRHGGGGELATLG